MAILRKAADSGFQLVDLELQSVESLKAVELRELYVALTRPTKTLVVIHARPLPEGLGSV